jgi:hypothetical protein
MFFRFQMRLKTGESSFLAVRAGLQNVLQIFVTNAANVFLLEVSPEYPILLEEQVTISFIITILGGNIKTLNAFFLFIRTVLSCQKMTSPSCIDFRKIFIIKCLPTILISG